jgi:hypothetical protein
MPASERGPARRVRDRQVLLLAAAVVLGVLAANVLSGIVRPIDDALGFQPVVVLLLVAVTVVVLVRAIRARRRDLDDAEGEERDPG